MRKLAAVIAALIVLIPVAAEARHRRPPAAKLVTGDTVQWGRLGTYCWSWEESPEEGRGQCVDAIYTWPRAKPARSGARPRIRFRVPACPSETTLKWWKEVDGNGSPQGRGRDLEVTKQTVTRDDEVVACRLLFRLPDRVGHAYLNLFTTWDQSFEYEHGTARGGDASYTFHLKLAR